MPFSTYIGVVTAFVEFLLNLLPLHTICLPSHRFLLHINNFETADSGDRGTNPLAMTINNPQNGRPGDRASDILFSNTVP